MVFAAMTADQKRSSGSERTHRRAFGVLLSASLLASGSAMAAQAVNRPYLQSVTPTSAVVVFRANQACPAQVRFAATNGDGAEQVATSPTSQAQHEVTLEGLQPGTEYRYTVEACGGPLEPEHTFRTAPVPGTPDVHFVALGDFGKGNQAQAAVAQRILTHDPDVIVTVGDNIYDDGTDAEFTQNFLRPMGALFSEVPLYPAFGNHDYAADDLRTSLQNFVVPRNNPRGTERYYSFDWGNVHFTVLDSICLMGEAESDECDVGEQLQWLESDLASTQGHWKVVLMHNVLYSSAKYGARPDEVGPMRAKLLPLFEAGGVDLVLSGDDHVYERSRPLKGTKVALEGTRGITYAVIGHGAEGRNWAMSQQDWSAYRNNTHVGFLEVKTQGGTLTASMVGDDGQTHDTFTITKPLPEGTPVPAEPGTPAEPTPTTPPDEGTTPPPGTPVEPTPTTPPDEGTTPPPGTTPAPSPGAPALPGTTPSAPGQEPSSGAEFTLSEEDAEAMGCAAAAGGPAALGVTALLLLWRRRRATR